MAARTRSSQLKPLLNKTCNKKRAGFPALLSLRFTSIAVARPAQAVARHAPDLVLVEAERHQFAHRLLRIGESGRHGDVEVEDLGQPHTARDLPPAQHGA